MGEDTVSRCPAGGSGLSDAPLPRMAVIVPAYNEAERIGDVGDLIRCVFGVDEDPVQARIGQHLGHGRVPDAVPQAHELPAGFQRALEGVLRNLHDRMPCLWPQAREP